MYEGVLIAESLRPGVALDDLHLVVRALRRVAPSEPTGAQPAVWTLLDFQVTGADVDGLVAALADALDRPGWYADLRSVDETVVVYPGRVFRYPRGDADGRAAAVAHGRELEIPDAHLDWPS